MTDSSGVDDTEIQTELLLSVKEPTKEAQEESAIISRVEDVSRKVMFANEHTKPQHFFKLSR